MSELCDTQQPLPQGLVALKGIHSDELLFSCLPKSQWQQTGRLVLGFSGGLDSSVLLSMLSHYPDFKKRLRVVHINHGVHPNSAQWQTHCHRVCQCLAIPFEVHALTLRSSASETTMRNARLCLWQRLVGHGDLLLLAHHQDDQLETFLMRLCNGSGLKGLRGMLPITQIHNLTVYRPLLTTSRKQLQQYAAQHALHWIEDPSNQDLAIPRNYIRQKVLPDLRAQYPDLNKGLQRTISKLTYHYHTAMHSDIEQRALNLLKAIRFDKNEQISPLAFHELIQRWLDRHAIYPKPRFHQLDNFLATIRQAGPDKQPETQCGEFKLIFYDDKIYLVNQSLLGNHSHRCSALLPKNRAFELPCTGMRYHLPNIIGDSETTEVFFWHKSQKHPRITNKQFKKIFQLARTPPWLREHTPLIFINGRLTLVPTCPKTVSVTDG